MKKEVSEFVGKKATLDCNGLSVEVKIVDVKSSYGRMRYLVTPASGSGEVWVEKITIIK